MILYSVRAHIVRGFFYTASIRLCAGLYCTSSCRQRFRLASEVAVRKSAPKVLDSTSDSPNWMVSLGCSFLKV